LKQIPVPEPTDIGTYVRNRDVAIALGKALFWDMQVGSDGVQSCATCHFRAGADPRSVNQLNPGGADNLDPAIDLGGPNYQLKASDFPLHGLPIPPTANRRCCVTSTTWSPPRGASEAFRWCRAWSDQGLHRCGPRPGVQHPGHQHAPVRAAQHPDHDQRRVQSARFLGSARP
jgi:hypothetical protein